MKSSQELGYLVGLPWEPSAFSVVLGLFQGTSKGVPRSRTCGPHGMLACVLLGFLGIMTHKYRLI